MMYRLLIVFLLFAACQRKTLTEPMTKIEVEIDTSLEQLQEDQLPASTLADVHHLLALGYEKIETHYDSLLFQMYFDPALKDSIRIQVPGSDTVYLTIGVEQNKSAAFYSYLDLLGYRFYGPEDHWTYFPDLPESQSLDTTLHSFFMIRNLLPSYSLSGRNIKPLEKSKVLFSRWTSRLRMANLAQIPAGHYGSSFNRKYKEQIITHPEWRGIDKGGNSRKWHINLKLCYSHPEVIHLYKQDALKRLKNLQKKTEPPYIMSMEPPDGDGYCQCQNCQNTSVSDQVYGLANAVAQFLYEHDTNAMVSLYGYNEHAAAPSFSLAENVIVGIVPYAFQSIGSPEVMMDQWESTGATLYLRDYLAIPIWNYDQPVYLPNSNFLNKIDHIKEARYLGYTFETTASFMAVGLQFYLLTQASWKTVNGLHEFERFLDRFFPGYQEDVRIIYENLPRLNTRNFAIAQQAVRKLISDSKRSNQPSVTKRLTDLEFYIEYLYLLSQFNSKKSDENTKLLLDKIMSEPGLRLLHPYGLYRTLKGKKKFKRNFDRTVNRSVDIPKSKGIQLSLRRRTKPEYQALNPEFYLDSVSTFKPIFIRNVSGILYVGDNHDGIVKFRAIADRLNSSAGCTVIIRDLAGNHVQDITIPHDNKWRDFEIRLTPGQFYRIRFRTPGVEMQLQGPNRPFAFTEPLYTRYLHKRVPFYFYVPKNIDTVRIQIPLKSNKVVVKSGNEVLYSLTKEEKYILEIKNKEEQVVEVIMYRHGLNLLNIPQLLSLHNKGIIYQE